MTQGESLMPWDRDWLRSRLTHEAIVGETWPCLVETWARIPEADRARLRFRFDVIDEPGRSASVGIPPDRALDTMRIVICVGRDQPNEELTLAFAHELAHVYLGHVDVKAARAQPVARILPGDVSAEIVELLLSAGWRARQLTAAEQSLEDDAWAQVRRWGFEVPDKR